jgi:multidrug efflux pump subunit AcrB
MLTNIGKDVLPKVNGNQFQVRLRAPEGTRMERTEEKTLKTIQVIKDIVGKENVSVTSAYVGQHPALVFDQPDLFVDGRASGGCFAGWFERRFSYLIWMN